MSIITVIAIIVIALLIYYAAMIGYDLYVFDKRDSSDEEGKEKAIDISDMASGFNSIPVNQEKPEQTDYAKACNIISGGISPHRLKREVDDFAEGKESQVLQSALCYLSGI